MEIHYVLLAFSIFLMVIVVGALADLPYSTLADVTSYNLSVAADQLQVKRRIVFYIGDTLNKRRVK